MHLNAQLLQRPNKSIRKSISNAQVLPRNRQLNSSVLHAPRHDGNEQQTTGNGQALEVLGLAGGVFRDEGDGGVEAGEAGDTGADEDEEEELVQGGAEAEDEGDEGWGDTEGDLVEGWGKVRMGSWKEEEEVRHHGAAEEPKGSGRGE